MQMSNVIFQSIQIALFCFCISLLNTVLIAVLSLCRITCQNFCLEMCVSMSFYGERQLPAL